MQKSSRGYQNKEDSWKAVASDEGRVTEIGGQAGARGRTLERELDVHGER